MPNCEERLDPHNGLMLAAHIDTLFDSGLISFANEGDCSDKQSP
jgi:putative restriction endonuclease